MEQPSEEIKQSSTEPETEIEIPVEPTEEMQEIYIKD